MKTTNVSPGEGSISVQEEAERTRPHDSIAFSEFLAIGLQVALVVGVALAYRLELERGLAVVAVLTLLGFLVHSWLPAPLRLPFFCALSTAAIGLLLRTDGLWLLGIGLALIAICHLSLGWWIRVTVLLLVAAGLATIRIGWLEAPWGNAVLPVLASIFMFRLILYTYDLKEERTPATIWQRLSYFFLLPNVCFPLFPVIDYKIFLRTYYDAPAVEIYQKGVFWMFRGVMHLLLYRLVYFLLPRAESDLPGILGVYVFMAMTYALYLRVSGLFHLIVGSLCLFGFNLPVTNNHYFLASSFNDLWRRINIYWKDFMMMTVFYPVFMGTRRWRMASRLVIATGIVFLVTWFFHSYQWFWLQGVFPVAMTDILFWGVLGVALAINSVWEAKHGGKRTRHRREWSVKEAMVTTLRFMGVFTCMAILWSLWNSSSLAEWSHRLLRATESSSRDLVVFFVFAITTLSTGILGSWLSAHGRGLSQMELIAWRHSKLLVTSLAAVLIVFSRPSIHFRLGEEVAKVVALAQSTSLNDIDRRRQERGYYEALSRATQFGANTFGFGDGLRIGGAAEWVFIEETEAAMATDDIRGMTLKPNVEMPYKGAMFRTNQWGLRDREYVKRKSPEVYRVALIGPSTAMGAGVNNEETFENVVEDALNRDWAWQDYNRIEILNFSVGGYGALDALYVTRNVVPGFAPDAVMYVAHPGESYRIFDRLRRRLALDITLGIQPITRTRGEYEPIMAILRASGATPDLPTEEFHRRVAPYREHGMIWVFREMISASDAIGAKFALLLVPIPGEDFTEIERQKLTRFVRDFGGVVLDLNGVFEGLEPEDIMVAKWDDHPNSLGHRLIAERLYEEIAANATALGVDGVGTR